ncbi:m-phase inducer phosphatase [Basidiobolus ranarum]|uniref:M-phase inducer phosphatase n=1 Tax=Basidiobolus ranarum TaxID=34480 RepID=A0ABR2VXY9_9FUNG
MCAKHTISSSMSPHYLPTDSSNAHDYSLAPPPKLRKTQSMCLTREEFLFSQTSKSSVLDSAGQYHTLPCYNGKEDILKRISANTLDDLISGKYTDLYDNLIIIDCRFSYEYNGGHIQGAINLNTKSELEEYFFNSSRNFERTIVIFHCEFSAQRGPRMALYLRNKDRELNIANYPNLFFPELYVLDGGYRHFYSTHKDNCEPQQYVEMNATQFDSECKKGMMRFESNFLMKRSRSRSVSWPREPASVKVSLIDRRTLYARRSNNSNEYGSSRGSLLNRLRTRSDSEPMKPNFPNFQPL